MKKISLIIAFVIMFASTVFASNVNSIYDVIGKSVNGCKIIDIIYIESPTSYDIICLKDKKINLYKIYFRLEDDVNEEFINLFYKGKK